MSLLFSSPVCWFALVLKHTAGVGTAGRHQINPFAHNIFFEYYFLVNRAPPGRGENIAGE